MKRNVKKDDHKDPRPLVDEVPASKDEHADGIHERTIRAHDKVEVEVTGPNETTILDGRADADHDYVGPKADDSAEEATDVDDKNDHGGGVNDINDPRSRNIVNIPGASMAPGIDPITHETVNDTPADK